MIPHQNSSSPYYTNLNPLNPNNNTTTTPSPLNPSFNQNTIVDNTTSYNDVFNSEITGNVGCTSYYYFNDDMNYFYGHDSSSYPHHLLGPYDNTNTTTTPSPLNPYVNPNTTPSAIVDNAATNNNAVNSEIVGSSSYYDVDMDMISQHGSGDFYDSSHYNLSFLLGQFDNTNTTTTPSPLHPPLNPNTTSAAASAIVDNTTTSNDLLNMDHDSSLIYDSRLYDLNPYLDPYVNTITNTTTIAATTTTTSATTNEALVHNTTTNNDVVGSEIPCNICSTSDGVTNNNNNNNMNLCWDTEFPPGYRFCPTDGELIYYYLEQRINHLKLPHNKMHDVSLYDTTPERLSQEYAPAAENEWYFFTERDRKYKNGERPNRGTAGMGYWKATGSEIPIHHPCKPPPPQVIGYKRSLVFHQGTDRRNGGKSSKTNWIMQEYRPVGTCKRKRLNDNDMGLDLVLCKIYYNNKNDNASKAKVKLEIVDEAMAEPEAEVANGAPLPTPKKTHD